MVIEVRSANMNDQARNRLAGLAKIVAAEAGWRVDVVTYEPEAPPQDVDRDDIARRVDEARRVADVSPDAAVMLTWSAIEGALHRLSQGRGLAPARRLAPRALIRALTIDGVLTDYQAAELDMFARLRHEIAHGMSSNPPEPERLDWLLRFALAAATNDPTNVRNMIDWFLAHYATPEDAALFYDSEDGEYFWLGAGPYEPTDVLQDQFDTALDADIAEAVEVVERAGVDWARLDQL